MRIDPKYFNRFIGICALITTIIIVYSTISYSQRQITNFKNNVSEVQADTLSFSLFSGQDSLRLADLSDHPMIIHFWGTWSDKSLEVGEFLDSYSDTHGDLVVIAASVKDSEENVHLFMDEFPFPASFHVVQGTDFYETVKASGVPSQIFIDGKKQIFDAHVGNDTTEIRTKLDQLLSLE